MFEYPNIRMSFEYSNTISEFEYIFSFFNSPRAVLLLSFQMKNYRPALEGG